MKKSPKYSVGSEVAYKGEDGCEYSGSVCRIAEVGKEYFMYTLDCGDGKRHSLYEGKITNTRKINE